MVDYPSDARRLLHGGHEEIAVQGMAYRAVDRYDPALHVKVQAADGGTLEIAFETPAESSRYGLVCMGLSCLIGQAAGATTQTACQTLYRVKHGARGCFYYGSVRGDTRVLSRIWKRERVQRMMKAPLRFTYRPAIEEDQA